MASPTDMGLTTRNLQSQLTTTGQPFIYEIRDERGRPFRHCGSLRDVELVIGHYPSSTYHKVYLSKPPETVDVSYTSMEQEKQLPESNLTPFDAL